MNFLMKAARKRQLKLIREAVVNTHKDGRLKLVGEDRVEFIEQDGKVRTLSAIECATDFWERWNNKMMADVGSLNANLGTFEISPDDIKDMILETLGAKKEA